MLILGAETSCDETAVSLVESKGNNLSVLSNIVSSQTKIHSKWGGVVPNLAAREHLKNIVPVLGTAFRKAKKSPKDIDFIAVTQGPGLIPALLIGTNAAKALSYIWQKPLLGIHHIEGHIYANFIRESLKPKVQSSKFPILCLVVSGGHTQLVLMKKHLDYEIVGQTLDDATGEAFDKVARILDLGFPGGPNVAEAATKIKNQKSKIKIDLPRPMINSSNLNFSFSGLKTAVLYKTREFKKLPVAALANDFQQAVVDVLVSKTIKAAKKYNPKTIMLAGGVSANKELREQMKKAVKNNFPDSLFIIPGSKYCIDNATMIATAGYYRWKSMTATQKKKALNNWKTIQADANLKLK
ncbi:MAG TPA: tRNA (adenosine(37)-N6)-threonylcarbamoyltransferase complex transferase subunit TsaD [Candidatus Moranbacteria bacterium]|nr:tRNA (adenosine(37)-N6)-threonylcarbamoyltransferase complex transferase subunit TsaD [Candidatus Moranbacteria bacterium]HDZ85414.1 tRNA (adenosine(37)-N6)-threonylcarbamoyltransferase complex transferase subunit TsaD [Candidatus Moranbacteria bacterium]